MQREGSKQLTDLVNAAMDYANAAKDVRDHSSHQPQGYAWDWPQAYKDRRDELLYGQAATQRALLTVAKKFVSNKRRKEKPVLSKS